MQQTLRVFVHSNVVSALLVVLHFVVRRDHLSLCFASLPLDHVRMVLLLALGHL